MDGEMRSIIADQNLLRYERIGGEERLLVLLNLGRSSVQVATNPGIVIAATGSPREGERIENFVELGGSEALLIKMEQRSAPES
jgi:hypothetical protein